MCVNFVPNFDQFCAFLEDKGCMCAVKVRDSIGSNHLCLKHLLHHNPSCFICTKPHASHSGVHSVLFIVWNRLPHHIPPNVICNKNIQSFDLRRETYAHASTVSEETKALTLMAAPIRSALKIISPPHKLREATSPLPLPAISCT